MQPLEQESTISKAKNLFILALPVTELPDGYHLARVLAVVW